MDEQNKDAAPAPAEGKRPRPRRRRPRLRWPARRKTLRPRWVGRLDTWLARLVVVHPTWLSAARLLVVVPLLVMGLRQVKALPTNPWLITGLFMVYVALDYLDGVAARHQRVEAERWRLLDKLTALPVLLSFCALCYDCLPMPLLGARIGLELLLVLLFLMGRLGRRSGRLRTGLEYTTLLAMLMVSEGWAPKLLTPRMVSWLLGINVAFTAVVVLAAVKVHRRRPLGRQPAVRRRLDPLLLRRSLRSGALVPDDRRHLRRLRRRRGAPLGRHEVRGLLGRSGRRHQLRAGPGGGGLAALR